MKTLQFTKMHALCNDFVVVNSSQKPLEITPKQIQKLAHRRSGIGFDQLLSIESSEDAEVDFKLRIFNSDGGEAEQCGNGTACVGQYLVDQGLVEQRVVTLRSRGGLLNAEILEHDSAGNQWVRLTLEGPAFEHSKVPFTTVSSGIKQEVSPVDDSVPVVSLIPVSMGNPHAVVFDIELDHDRLEQIGRAIQLSERFPESTNVEFVEIESRDRMHIRIIERGTGETMACGSGSCAATVAAHRLGLIEDRVTVSQSGGQAIVEWLGDDHPVCLTVPASYVFSGEIPIGE